MGGGEREEREEMSEEKVATLVRAPENEGKGVSEGGRSLVRDTVGEMEARLAVAREEGESEGEGVTESVI